jgi:hypothetical protein
MSGPQAKDRIVLDGAETELADGAFLPASHPRIARLDPVAHWTGESDLKKLFLRAFCRRGYIATWEVRDQRLWLLSLRGEYRVVGDEPLLADWISGQLRVPLGPALHYTNTAYRAVYQRELHLALTAGRITAQHTVDNAER